jgi:nitrite reductase/ring-hydroxylating ferredoxin subunit
MSFERVASLTKFPPGSLAQIQVGDEAVALCNVGGDLYAVDGICPHSCGPLGHGALHGTTIVCPFHAWEFDCITGEHDRNPDLVLRRFAVKTSGDDILVDVSQPRS